MQDHSTSKREDGKPDANELPESQRLLMRLVDHEADHEELRTFESLAQRDPSLWRDFALRQREMDLLSRAAVAQLDLAVRIDLPPRSGQRDEAEGEAPIEPARAHGPAPTARSRGLIPWVGWTVAAGLLLWVAVHWFSDQRSDDSAAHRHVPAHTETEAAQSHDSQATPSEFLPPEQYLRAYLRASFVIGQLDPVLLETRKHDDGSIELRFIRRIEEILTLEPGEPLPIDDLGRLMLDPEKLRTGTTRNGS